MVVKSSGTRTKHSLLMSLFPRQAGEGRGRAVAQPARGRLERHGDAARRLPRAARPQGGRQQVDPGGRQHLPPALPQPAQPALLLASVLTVITQLL